MKLEQLTHYLPHKLQAYGASDIWEIKSLSTNNKLIIGNGVHTQLLTIDDFVIDYDLILRPLSDLTDKIKFNGEVINPIEEIYNDSWMALGFEIVTNHDDLCVIKSNEDNSTLEVYKTKPIVNMWWITNKLISMHFDVFGLIEKGFAVNINKML